MTHKSVALAMSSAYEKTLSGFVLKTTSQMSQAWYALLTRWVQTPTEKKGCFS